MKEAIDTLNDVKNAIQRLEHFVPTEHNCKQILGSVQRLDMVIEYLSHIHIVEEETTDGEQTN
ncbi:MAG: hypothetical protein KBS60_04235 [Phascolarctobacterium sp.]|nr:hypothetical protein [Candidatus Phascolarctobacterium caballi]